MGKESTQKQRVITQNEAIHQKLLMSHRNYKRSSIAVLLIYSFLRPKRLRHGRN